MNAVSIDVEMLEQIPSGTMLRLVDDVKKTKRNATLFNHTVSSLAPLFCYLEEQEIDIRFDFNSSSIDVAFAGSGDKFRAVWAELRRAGYEPHTRPQKGATGHSCFWELAGYARIWMAFSSTVCRRVQIGTKTVEQPVYETVCSDMPAIDVDSEQALLI